MPTIAELKQQGKEKLMQVNAESASLDAEVLLRHLLGLSKEQFIIKQREEVTEERAEEYFQLIAKREKHTPIAYITGKKEFYGYDFGVNNQVLIPRPETEMIVDHLLQLIKQNQNYAKSILVDVGTGSGAIIISTLNELAKENIKLQDSFAIDISETALATAKANAGMFELEDRINFYQGSLLQPLVEYLQANSESYFYFAANLPYISPAASLPVDVELFEPQIALRAEEEGLKIIYQFISQLISFMPQIKCVALLEFSSEQKEILENYLRQTSLKNFTFLKDLEKKWRFLKISI